MTNNINHIENQPEFSPGVMEVISGTRIAWSKTREEIWSEMLAKTEGNGSAGRKVKTISLQAIKYAAAAIIAILTAIPSAMYLYTKKIETQMAQQTEIFLPDNSRIKVLENSALSYKPLLWMVSRTVKLDGEGSFEVQKGKKFEVVSEKGKTVVLGTRFNVYARKNEYNVTCESGRVKVTEFAHQNEVIIDGGQKAILKPDGNFEIIEKTDSRTEAVSKSQNKSLEEEKEEPKTGLTSTPEQEKLVNLEENKKPAGKQNAATAGKQIETEEKAEESKPDNSFEPDFLKEQSQVQNENAVATQNQEHTKASSQIQDESPEQKQNQERTHSEGKGNTPVKDKFRSSLTPEQLIILEDKKMSREEIRKAFLQSLSSEQKQLLKEQNEERDRQAEANKNGVTERENMNDQQKSQVREQMRESTGNENMDQQRQQNRENKQNSKPDGEKGPDSGSSSDGNNKDQTGKGNL